MSAPYERLIDAINQTAPAFSIHIGDIKSGSSRCDDEELEHQRWMQADPFESKRWGQVFPPDSGFTVSVG